MNAGLQRQYLLAVREFLKPGWIESIRVSARPDELQRDRLAFLREHGVRTVEVGVQSLSDRVLEESRRGYGAAHAVEAIRNLQKAGFEVGAQIMVGLPGDTGRACEATVEALCDLRPDFVRIYPVLVLRGTGLARRFRGGRYRPLDLSTAVALCACLLARFRKASIPVIRIGLHPEVGMHEGPGGMLAGPVHPAFGFLVQSFLYRQELLRVLAERGGPVSDEICFRIHPDDRSLFSGHQRENLRMLQASSGTERITVVEDRRIARGRVERLEPTETAMRNGMSVPGNRLPNRRGVCVARPRGNA